MNLQEIILKRKILGSLTVIIPLLLFYNQVKEIFFLSFEREIFSQTIVIPVASLYIILLERKRIFTQNSSSYYGLPLIVSGIGIFFYINGGRGLLDETSFLSLVILSVILFWIGGFILLYGLKAFKNALFPLFYLLCMIPVPAVIMDRVILFLQNCSADVTYFYFTLLNIPVYREGFIFYLPKLTIEIAKECSGIRSSIMLTMTSLLLGYFFLRSWGKRLILVAAVVPITILKNALRITVLTLLGIYVDKSVLYDKIIHGRSGYPFFLLALISLVLILVILVRIEKGYLFAGKKGAGKIGL